MSDDDYEDKTMIMAPRAAKKLASAPKARLKCTNTALLGLGPGAEIVLEGDEVTVGRGKENTVALQAEGISRKHARFYPGKRSWGVEDLGSTNGIKVNGQKTPKADLAHGDKVNLGGVPFVYSVDSEAAAKTDSDPTFTTKPAAAKPRPAAPAAAASKSAAPKPAAKPAAPKPAPKPAASAGSNALLWVIVVLVAVAVGVGAYFVLV